MELSKIGLLLAKVETTYGTDPTPTAASNNIAVHRGQVQWDHDAESIDRDILDGGFSRVVGINARPHTPIKFRTELRGNRTDGSAADISSGSISNVIEIDPLLRGCDMAATYTAESSGSARDGYVTYAPTIPSDVGTGLTFYFYSQSKLYKATGCKGTIENIGIEAGHFGYIDWSFMGKYVAPVDSSIPASPTFLGTKPPTCEKPATYSAQVVTFTNATDVCNLTSHSLLNGDRVKFTGTVPAALTAGVWYYVRDKATSTFKLASTLGGSAIALADDGTGSITMDSAPALVYDDWAGSIFSKANIKLGNSVVMREDGNSTYGVKGFVITDRDTKGDFDPESVTEATHPLWADWQSAESKILIAQIGTLTGNRITITAKTKIEKLTYEDRNGKRIQNVQFGVRAAALGDSLGSELSLRFH